ncbi:uncharacterized protein PFL1_00511 [Pseudozyma flocculosa PF-1]|uniref:rRNA biogenesis protein RRP36 n=1 Tax=Pseudozyma flocculosa TaxID=84751 RepID=A0A5C3ET86_9BASI|nr:uncharacterized protein PFL1_00511 [Pseudozyma flocculosa PF-1]EPQ32315.1 hypothetical protein PFL1_00511 [Pseudozyma flocculosa PF-1]SPO34727.1 related to rRNA biogenesis protein RRP36 [Pseudozyma flocculosa]
MPAASSSARKAPTAARGKPSKQQSAPAFEQDSDDDQGSLHLSTDDDEASDSGDEEQVTDDSEDEDDQRSTFGRQNDDEDDQERRFAQFVDEDDLDDDDDDEEDDDGSEEDDSDSESDSDVGSDEEAQVAAYTRKQQEKQLKEQMKNIPFSALVKARQQLGDDSQDSDADDSASIGLSDLEPDEFEADRQRLAAGKKGKKAIKGRADAADEDDNLEAKRREVKERLRQLKGRNGGDADGSDAEQEDRRAIRRRDREEREQKELEKRANKHAPTEMSSRKPVSRRRNVVEIASSKVRDPRFDSLSGGATNSDLFSKSYSFLPELLKNELQTLKTVHGKLRKQEANQAGPKAKSEVALGIRAERQKVEMALRRAEGLACERERRDRETELKRKLKRQNKERVEQGLKPFYVKKSEQRAMLLKDKYDQLAGGDGGDAASKDKRKSLKKALERRRKKNVQKERKDMPVGMSLGLGGAAVPKRKRDGDASAAAGPSRTQSGQKPSRTDGQPAKKRGRRG